MNESNNSIIRPEVLDDIWKMSDKVFYKEVLKKLDKNIKSSNDKEYELLEFKSEIKMSKNQKKLLNERLRKYRDNLKYNFANDSMVMTFLVSLIAVIISAVVYFITSVKGFTGEMYSISGELESSKNSKIEIDKARETYELLSIGEKVDYLTSFNEIEANIFLFLLHVLR